MTKMYLVSNVSGTYPPGGGGFLAFNTKGEAETYVADQYAAQIASPFYPESWWVITEAELPSSYEVLHGYPSPGPAVLPNIPLDVAASTDGTNFTISWTPDSPPVSPELYTVTCFAQALPGFDVGGSPPFQVYQTSGVSGTSLTVAGVAFPVPPTPFNTSLSAPPYSMPVTFTVAAQNVWGVSAQSGSTSEVTAYGPSAAKVPAAVTSAVGALVSTGSPLNEYQVTWNQPYPAGAGTPEGWYLGSWASTGVAIFSANNTGSGYRINDPAIVPASGTPTTGAFTFYTSAGSYNSLKTSSYPFWIVGYNAAGATQVVVVNLS